MPIKKKLESGIFLSFAYLFFKIQKHVPVPVGSSRQLQIFLSLCESPERFVLPSLEPLGDWLEICCSPVPLTALWAPQGDAASSAQLELLYLEQC